MSIEVSGSGSSIAVDVVAGGVTAGQVASQIAEALERGSLPDIVEGDAGKVLTVNDAEDGVEWGTVVDGDVPAHDADPMAHPPLRLRINGVEHRHTIASVDPIELVDPATIVESGTGDWDIIQVQEPGAPVWDPDLGAWMLPYCGVGEEAPGGTWVTHLGAVISTDGEEWSPHPDNPISGDHPGDDPFIARAVDGSVWRDSQGRALMFCEERPSGQHRGIELWRSGGGVLDGWTLVGRVLDRNDPGWWDSADRTSPTVIHDGAQLVMLYEGRSDVNVGDGRIGRAVSTDEGETWTVDPVPLIDVGEPGSWNSASVAPDDIIRVGDAWVLLGHGDDGTGVNRSGRWVTLDHPADWHPGSFVEMTGNPFDTSATVMFVDPTRVLRHDGGLQLCSVRSPFVAGQGGEVSLSEIEGRLDDVEAENTAQDTRLDAGEAVDRARPVMDLLAKLTFTASTATGSMVDVATFGTGVHDALDPSSDLDLDGGATIVPTPTPTLPLHQAAALAPSPPQENAVLHGARVRGVTVSGSSFAHNSSVSVGLARGDGVPPSGRVAITGSDAAKWTVDDGASALGVAAQADSDPVDVLIVLDAPDAQVLGVVVGSYLDAVGEVAPTITIDSIEWLWKVPAADMPDSGVEWTEVARHVATSADDWPTFTGVPAAQGWRIRWLVAGPDSGSSGGLMSDILLTVDGDSTSGRYLWSTGASNSTARSSIMVGKVGQGGGGIGEVNILRARRRVVTGTGQDSGVAVRAEYTGWTSAGVEVGQSGGTYMLPDAVPPLSTFALACSRTDHLTNGDVFVLEVHQ